MGSATSTTRGLNNLGNTCYINVIIQILLENISIQQQPNQNILKKTPLIDSLRLVADKHDRIHLENFVELLSKETGKNLKVQSDAGEFMNDFFSLIDNEDSTILESFRLQQYQVTQTCKRCNTPKSRTSKKHVYQLLLSSSGETVQERLDKQLEHPIANFYCEFCGSQVVEGGTERISFVAPENLILILPWSYENRQWSQTTPITLPEGHIMELQSVVLHYGSSLSSGHYVAAIRKFRTNQWILCNDQNVSKATSEQIQSGVPTVLLYKRKSAINRLAAQSDCVGSHPSWDLPKTLRAPQVWISGTLFMMLLLVTLKRVTRHVGFRTLLLLKPEV